MGAYATESSQPALRAVLERAYDTELSQPALRAVLERFQLEASGQEDRLPVLKIIFKNFRNF